ncbi:MAG: hypothetical protein ABS94_27315 [Variovorax sp. SCN 67-85]|nr:MAG: hypothetical protein ABS94_27315 [Variovorax sp. SCN 67-85]
MTGTFGAVVSTVSEIEASPLVPAAFTAVAVYLCAPSDCAGSVRLQLPLASAVVEPRTVEFSVTVTMAPVVALPTRVGVVSSVTAPGARLPCLLPWSSTAWPTLTTTPEVSTVNARGALAALVLPAASVSVCVMLCAPSPSGVLRARLHLPSLVTAALPTRVAPSYILTMSPASAPLPLKVGEASSVEPPAGIVPVTAPWSSVATTVPGVAGGMVSSTIG